MNDLGRTDGWTVDDLEALPPDGVRRELLDGVLLVHPSPTDIHQIITGRLAVALDDSCPAEFQVTQAVEIRFSSRLSLIPDVLVATDQAAQRRSGCYAPHEVRMAVEIVSPSSTSMDRITKPALYASAGIPFYWRVETTNGLVVETFKIDPEHQTYRPVGTFTSVIATDEPWEINLPLKRITPRYL
jgi:Uma2 family endonuclease